MPKAKPSVFISHSWSDRDWVHELVDSLERLGQEVWTDSDGLSSSESFQQSLEKRLRESKLLVMLLGPDDATRPNVFFEVGAALAMGKPVVFVRSPDLNLCELPPALLRHRFLVKRSPEATAQELIHDIAA